MMSVSSTNVHKEIVLQLKVNGSNNSVDAGAVVLLRLLLYYQT